VKPLRIYRREILRIAVVVALATTSLAVSYLIVAISPDPYDQGISIPATGAGSVPH